MRPFTYQHPASLTAAVIAATHETAAPLPSILAPVQFIAGGTNMSDYMRLGVMQPEGSIDINTLTDRSPRAIEVSDAGMHFGALVRRAAAEEHPEVKARYLVQFCRGAGHDRGDLFDPDPPPQSSRAVLDHCLSEQWAIGGQRTEPERQWLACGTRQADETRPRRRAHRQSLYRRRVRCFSCRMQGFTFQTYRAETRHAISMGANPDGRITAFRHEGTELISRPDPYFVGGTDATSQIYGYGAVLTKVSVAKADRNAPGYMRSPAETPYVFALETAMDEMADKLGMDPVEFRRINDTMIEPIEGRPLSSPSLQGLAQAIGFIAAGAIFVAKGDVHNLTSAANLWLAAAAGIAAGTGQYFLIGTALVLGIIVITLVRVFSRLLPGTTKEES